MQIQSEIHSTNGKSKALSHQRALGVAVDILENEEEILILADFPGVTRDAIEVSLDGPELVLAGTRDTLTWRRTFRVPSTVDPSRAVAELDAGVLCVRLPKREEAKPRRIEVKPG